MHEPVASTGHVCAHAYPLEKAPKAINPHRKLGMFAKDFKIANNTRKTLISIIKL